MMNTSMSLADRILTGQEVKCEKCGKGIYKPFNPKAERNHTYVCDKCGNTIHFIPDATVE